MIRNDGNLRYGERTLVDADSGAVVFAKSLKETDSDSATQYKNRHGLPLGFTLQTGWRELELEVVALSTTNLAVGTRLRSVIGGVVQGPLYGVTEIENSSSEGQLITYKLKAIELVYRGNAPSDQGTLLEITSDMWATAATIQTRVDELGNKLVDIHIPALTYLFTGNIFYLSLGSQNFEWFDGESEQSAHYANTRILDKDVIQLRIYSDTQPTLAPLDITLKYTGTDDFIVVGGLASVDAATASDPRDVEFFDVFLRKQTNSVTFNGEGFPFVNGPYKLNFETESSS